jgi:hypothetical protein
MATQITSYGRNLAGPLMALWFVGTPAMAQSASNETDLFQTRIKDAARNFTPGSAFKNLSADDREELVDFVVGNMLFVILHELGHAAITEMGLPVLGKPEDAADSFATVRLISNGSTFTQRVLAEAAKGWFLSDRRDRDTDDTVAYYDEHGLDQQRAYQIVCLMVGSDEKKFKSLADETKLPEERQENCVGDYSNAAYSWDLVLKPHVRTANQPKVDIAVIYDEAEGGLRSIANVLRSVKILEEVVAHTGEALLWPTPFKLEALSCGFPNARWDLQEHKLFVCYELAADFAELYRGYGSHLSNVRALPSAKKKRR